MHSYHMCTCPKSMRDWLVTWLIHMWRDTFLWDVTNSYHRYTCIKWMRDQLWHDAVTHQYVNWHISMRHEAVISHLYAFISHLYAVHLHKGDVTVGHASTLCRCICDMNSSRPIGMCHVTYGWGRCTFGQARVMWLIHTWRDTFLWSVAHLHHKHTCLEVMCDWLWNSDVTPPHVTLHIPMGRDVFITTRARA